MKFPFSFRPALLAAAILFVPCLQAQQPAPASKSAQTNAEQQHGRLILVLPFENRSTQPNLDWIAESIPEVANHRLDSAGFLPIAREDRLYALDHLGLPPDFQPSRASTIRLAQTLDADYVVLGTYTTDGKHLTTTARILDVNSLKLSAPIDEQGDLPRLLEIVNNLSWHVVKQLDPTYPVAEQTFAAADANLSLVTFENYIRGLVESSPTERSRHLKEAVRLSPNFSPAWVALGKLYFAAQNYEQAAAAFGHLQRTDPHVLAAEFYRGLAFFYTGNYPQAEDAFAFVSTRLPLPEVVNNQAVAASRRNKDAAPLFEQAIAADPNDPDYHFNLAVAFRRRNDLAGARREIADCLKLRPQDTEAQAFSAALQSANAPVKTNAALSTSPAPAEPLERIKRTYNEASFRQAAFEIEQIQAMKLAAMAPGKRADALTANGTQYLNRGLLLEAEREFQTALQADSGNSAAHAGLAQVRERSGDADDARRQAQQSLQLQPNVTAHMVLARIDLQSNQLAPAATEVAQALRLEPKNSAALGMRQALESRGQQVQ